MDRPHSGQTPFMTTATRESAAPAHNSAESLGAIRRALRTVATLLRQTPAYY